MRAVLIRPDDTRTFEVIEMDPALPVRLGQVMRLMNGSFFTGVFASAFAMGEAGVAEAHWEGRHDDKPDSGQNILASEVLRPGGDRRIHGDCLVTGAKFEDLDDAWVERIRTEAQALGWVEVDGLDAPLSD